MSIDVTPFAETNFRNERRRFGIKLDDRRRHMYLIGKTGMGKTTMIENMVLSDIRAGHGVALIDPHGDLIEKVVDYIPSNRVNDVVYFNPSDSTFPIAFNVLENVNPELQHLIASGLVGVFKKIYAESWGPRLEYVLRNAILALLDYPGSTLLGIMRILVDKTYRAKVIEKIKDPVVRSFWVDEYANYPDKFQVEAIAPIQNKVGQFLANALIRNIVGQVKSSINMREIMDQQKIFLVNLAKGRVGEDTSALLGAMIITKLQLAAMERVDIPEKDRRDFFLYVDEFQNFATDSFANILSEARKYRLDLIIAHQYIEQLSEQVAAAVFGNVGTLICFRVGGADAEFLEKEFTPRFVIEDLVSLAKYDIYLKLMIDGVASEPFSATTLPPLANGAMTGNREKVINVSRERYAKPRAVIEEKIARWTGMLQKEGEDGEMPNSERRPERTFSETYKGERRRERGGERGGERSGERRRERGGEKKSKKEYPITCDVCGKHETVFFDPDPNKPIYCKACLKKVKEGQAPAVKKSEGENKREQRQEQPRQQEQQQRERPSRQKTEPVIIVPPEASAISLEEALQSKKNEEH